MKRIVASVGLAALGAASLETLHAQPIGADKPWSVSLALRGFYDDNVNTSPSGSEIDTFGFEVSPSASFGIQGDQTSASLTGTYDFKYYDDKPDPSRNRHYDQTFTVAARLMHAFSERTSLSIADSFVIGQEPDVLRSGNFFTTAQYISGDNIRNYGSINLNHQFSDTFGIEVGYANTLVDYDDDNSGFPDIGFGPGVTGEFGGIPFDFYPSGVVLTRSGLLDRLEHSIHADARWTVQPTTVALVGYMFGFTDYTADEPIGVVGTPGNIANNMVVYSDSRNSRAHYGYVGVEHSFRPDFTGSVRVGARATEYYNSPNENSDIGPYATASLRYLYAPGSDIEVGVAHDRRASDLFGVSGTSITTDAESTSAYISLAHRILPNLTGSASFTFQNSTYNGGFFDDVTERFYIAGVGLEYQINRHLAASVSYNFDKLDSDFRDYTRNRVFVGATFVY